MLLMGLGANDAKMATANTSLITSSPGAVAPTHGPFGYTRWGIDQLMLRWFDTLNARVSATRADLDARWGSYMPEGNFRSPAQRCSAWRFSKPIDVDTMFLTHYGYDPTAILRPIGLAAVLGVPVDPLALTTISEENPFVATYAPTDEQRFYADVEIYASSQIRLADLWGLKIEDGAQLTNMISAVLNQGYLPTSLFFAKANRFNYSVDEMYREFGFGWAIDGYSMNSIEPTAEERTQAGGLRAFYNRGGFLLHIPMVEGAQQLNMHWINITTGYLQCQAEPGTATPANRVVANYTPVTGDGNVRWRIYVDVSQGAANQYRLIIKPLDRSLSSRAISGIAGLMKGLASGICANRSTISERNNTTLLAELCSKQDNTKCTKGTPGCSCTKPTAGQNIYVAAVTAATGVWCDRYASLQPTTVPDPGFVPFDPATIVPPKIPWWLVVVGGVTVGAALFTRK